MVQLRSLNLSNNHLTAIPPEIGQLTKLQSLTLNGNYLTTLPPEIGGLTNLRELYLGENRINALPPEIGHLTYLTTLSVGPAYSRGEREYIVSEVYQAGDLSSLPSEINKLTSLTELDLRYNPLPLPPEILEKTHEPQVIIRAYFDYLADQSRPLNEIKLVLVGEGSVGKTSLVNCLLYDRYDPQESKTEGIAIHRWEIVNKSISETDRECTGDGIRQQVGKESKIRVNVWDFGGQEIMHATHQFFLTKRTLYLLVIDTRMSESENRLDYWLSILHSFAGQSPVLIVGNKTDEHPLDLDERGLLAEYPAVQDILATSCATGEGILKLREAIAEQIARMPYVNDPLLTTWFDVKAKLETMAENYIPHSHYIGMCRAAGIRKSESQRVLLGFLHDLGVVLHFPDPRLETTNILNPEWVTRGVYRILNTRLSFEEQGILTWEMLACILDDEPYREKRMFIVDMMQKFELCYELPDRAHTYLIPDLLPKEAPETGDWADTLAFEVHYTVLPGSILTRLIVRMHRHIQDRIAWRTGVLLACEGNEALVRADLSTNLIRIRVRGAAHGRRVMLTRIREHLGAIHASFAGIEAKEKVPVPGHSNIPPVDYIWLRELERKRVSEFYPPGLTEPISVSKLLNGIEPPAARRQHREGTTYHIDARSANIGGIGDEHEVNGGVNFELY